MEKKIYQVCARVFRVSPNALSPNSSPDNVEGWDSARHIDLVMALEDEFGIELDEDKVLELLSMELIVEAVKTAVAQKK